MKMIEGFFDLAIWKRVLINLNTLIKGNLTYYAYFSDSPTYLEVISAEETEKKVASASVAQALAK